MNNKKIYLFISIVLLSGLLSKTVFSEEVYLETRKGEIAKIPVTVVIAGDDQELKSSVMAILINDLERSLYFNLIKIDGIRLNGVPDRVNESMRAQLSSSGVEALVVAQVVRDRDKIRLEGRLY